MSKEIAVLGDLTKIRTGKLDANASNLNGKYPFFTCAIKPLRIDTYSYECECVLVAGNGDLNVKYYDGCFDAYQRTYIIEPTSKSLDCRYLYHFLDSYLGELRKLSIGGVIKYIKIGNLADAHIPLPPLEEQRRIAAILDRSQLVIDKATHRSSLLSDLCVSLFAHCFGLPAVNPFQFPLHRLVDICNPKQWSTISSKQLMDSGYPVFGANGLIGYFDSFNHPDPTVLVTCRGATCGTINVTPPRCYVTGNSMAMDEPDPSVITIEYLEWVLRLRGMHDVISGSAQPQITRQGLGPITIPVPPLESQHDFANKLRAVMCQREKCESSLAAIVETADSLISHLLAI